MIGNMPPITPDAVCSMMAARVLAPRTKPATTRWRRTTTPADEFGVARAGDDALYAATDWLLAHQDTIEKKQTARHLADAIAADAAGQRPQKRAENTAEISGAVP
jgi:hypothetical protein